MLIDEIRLQAGRRNRFGVTALFEIIVAECCAGAAVSQLLKLCDDLLPFFALARTYQRGAEIVERGGVVRFHRHRGAQDCDRFRILSLLRVELAQVYIGADVLLIDL